MIAVHLDMGGISQLHVPGHVPSLVLENMVGATGIEPVTPPV
jgi:hypothetical protein